MIGLPQYLLSEDGGLSNFKQKIAFRYCPAVPFMLLEYVML